MYLADNTGKLLPKDVAKRYEAIQWADGPAHRRRADVRPVDAFQAVAGPGNDYAMTRYQTEVKRLYELLEQRLGRSAYLGGRRIFHRRHRDVSVDPQSRQHGREMGRQPEPQALVRGDIGPPGRQEAIEIVGGIKSNRETASQDYKDRFFNRGKYARA